MLTPAGTECKYYYSDFYRGRSTEACRLIERNPDSLPWKSGLCRRCPVPEILRANASETLKLEAAVVKKFFGLQLAVQVEGWCSECFSVVPEPRQGCPNCGRQPSILDLEEGPE